MTAVRDDAPRPQRGGPLGHLTVVGIEQAVAAPLATRHLADLGARVIKVERPGGGDFARRYDGTVDGLSSFFLWLNRGKESLTLDLKDPGVGRILEPLLAGADVLVQNLAPGAAARLGLDADSLRQRHPSLVVATVTGYGTDGPWRSRKAYDLLIQAETGLLSLTGTEQVQAKVPISVADIAAGMYTFAGILAALIERDRTGIATPVEVSLIDALADWISQPLYYAMGSGAQPPRSGTHHATIAPYGSYLADDGHPVMLAVQNEREWATLCTEVLGRPDLVADERFADNARRVENRLELDAVITAFCATRTAVDLVDELDRAGIAAARLNVVADLVDHPALAGRDRWVPTTTEVGARPTLRSPLDAGRLGALLRGVGSAPGVPALGADTDRILADLGLSDDEIDRLRAGGRV